MMTIPNIITLSRIFLIPVFVALYYFLPAYLPNRQMGLLILRHLTIFLRKLISGLLGCMLLLVPPIILDGYLARKLNMTSQLGAFLDPVADKLMVSTALILCWWISIPSDTHWYITLCCADYYFS